MNQGNCNLLPKFLVVVSEQRNLLRFWSNKAFLILNPKKFETEYLKVIMFRNLTRFSLMYSEYHICERKCDLESPGEKEYTPHFPATGLSTMPLRTNKEGTYIHYKSQDGSL